MSGYRCGELVEHLRCPAGEVGEFNTCRGGVDRDDVGGLWPEIGLDGTRDLGGIATRIGESALPHLAEDSDAPYPAGGNCHHDDTENPPGAGDDEQCPTCHFSP